MTKIIQSELNWRSATILLCWLCFSSTLFAQPTYQIQSYGVKDGLPTYFTKKITQDKDGYLWIATDDGLVRFNGSSMELYQTQFASKYIKDIVARGQDELWVLSDAGLYRVSLQNTPIQITRKVAATDQVTDSTLNAARNMFFDEKRNVFWFGETGGITRWDERGFKRYQVPAKYQSNVYINPYFFFPLTENKTVSFSHNGYVLMLDDSGGVKETANLRHLFRYLHALVPLSSGNVLIGADSGVFECSLSPLGEVKLLRKYGNEENIMGLLERQNGEMVFTTRDMGVFRVLEDGTTELIIKPNLQNVNGVFEDRDKLLWVSSDQGFAVIAPNTFRSLYFPGTYQYTQSLIKRDTKMYSIADNVVYAITMESGMRPVFTKVFDYDGETLLSLTTDGTTFWAGTSDGRLLRYANGMLTYEVPPTSNGSLLSNESIFNLLLDSKGRVWIIRASKKGITRRNTDGTFTHFREADGLTTRPLDIEEDEAGRIYVTGVGGISFFFQFDETTQTFKNLSDIAQIIETDDLEFAAHDISVGAKGIKWLATNYGLFKWDGAVLLKMPGFDQFPVKLIRSVMASPSGQVWIGAEHGLFQYTGGKLLDYDLADGLPSVTINFRKSLFDHEERLWVGTNNGLAWQVTPLTETLKTPTPSINALRVAGQPFDLNKSFIVQLGHNIQFDITSLVYPESQLLYQHRILKDGLEYQTWSAFYYSNMVSPKINEQGNFVVEVRAIKKGRSLSDAVNIGITIYPPWYNSWMARFLYVLVGFSILYVMVRYRNTLLDKRLAEEKLRRIEERLRVLIDQSPIVLFTIESDGRFSLLVGKELHKIGIKEEDLIGVHFKKYYKEPEILAKYEHAFATGEAVEYVRAIRDSVFETKVMPLKNRRGEVERLICVGTDITDRNLFERELIKAKEEADRANMAKSMFLANMSHELRTPLNAIMGFAQILVRNDQLDEKTQHYVRIMYQSGEHLLNMINEILDLSKIEAGKMELKPEQVYLSEMLDSIAEMFKVAADKKGLTYTLIRSTPLPDVVEWDQHKVRQILINVVGNAIKFTSTGSVTLDVSACVHLHKNAIRFIVADTGPGIPEDRLSLIFQPFQQFNEHYSQGTGLGLSITKSLAEMLGGTIRILRTTQQGSEFELIVPYMEVIKPLLVSESQQMMYPFKLETPKTALVVDDIPENRKLVVEFLTQSGFTCTEAVNGKEAVQAFVEHLPDIIMMDIVMPVMDGREAMKAIRKLPGGKTTPILAITASGFDDAQQELLTMGFDAYIRKPFKVDEFYAEISRCLNLSASTMSNTPPQASVDKASYSLSTIAAAILSLPVQSQQDWVEALELNDIYRIENLLEQAHFEDADMTDYLRQKMKTQDFKFWLSLGETIERLQEND